MVPERGSGWGVNDINHFLRFKFKEHPEIFLLPNLIVNFSLENVSSIKIYPFSNLLLKDKKMLKKL